MAPRPRLRWAEGGGLIMHRGDSPSARAPLLRRRFSPRLPLEEESWVAGECAGLVAAPRTHALMARAASLEAACADGSLGRNVGCSMGT